MKLTKPAQATELRSLSRCSADPEPCPRRCWPGSTKAVTSSRASSQFPLEPVGSPWQRRHLRATEQSASRRPPARGLRLHSQRAKPEPSPASWLPACHAACSVEATRRATPLLFAASPVALLSPCSRMHRSQASRGHPSGTGSGLPNGAPSGRNGLLRRKRGPSNNQMQRTKPAQATELRR